MSAHTEGPWHWVIEDHSMATLGVGDDPGSGDPFVLALGPCESCADRANPKEWAWGRCHVPTEANARLIAAAPDLLEACEAMLAVSDSPEPIVAQVIAVSKARAAISKAGGES